MRDICLDDAFSQALRSSSDGPKSYQKTQPQERFRNLYLHFPSNMN